MVAQLAFYCRRCCVRNAQSRRGAWRVCVGSALCKSFGEIVRWARVNRIFRELDASGEALVRFCKGCASRRPCNCGTRKKRNKKTSGGTLSP